MAQSEDGATIQTVAQGRCTECDQHDNNYTQQSRDVSVEDGITRELVCDCGATATVRITDSGIESDGPITHEDASWNREA